MQFVELCRKMIAFDSSPSHGTKDLVLWLAKLAQSKNLSVEIQEESLHGLPQANILIRPQAERASLEFLLQTHLDTPDPGPFGLWTETGHNPFDAHIIDQKIHGVGTADVKLDFLCKLEALSQAQSLQKPWRLPPVLVGTFGEELGMMGSLRLIRKNKLSAKMALIGEPSNLQLITAGKGMAAVEIRIPYSEDEKKYRIEHNLSESTSSQSRIFHGKAAHSSTPHLGDSAIKKMFEHLLQLPSGIVIMEIEGGVNFNTVSANAFLDVDPISRFTDPMAKKLTTIYQAILQLEKKFLDYTDNDFTPPNPTLNIGRIETFEDYIFIGGNCRIGPSVSNEVYEQWMRDLTEVCQQVGADFKVADYKRPYRTDENSMLVRGCLAEMKNLGLSTSLTTQSSSNEASLWSRIGVECVSFGPGLREGNIHTPKENVATEDLKKAILFYRSIIERFCL